MKNRTQSDWVVSRLLATGEISRNICLRERITRLSAIIQDLEEAGWEFNAQYRKENGGRNFVYYLKKSPYKKETFTVEGRTIERIIKA